MLLRQIQWLQGVVITFAKTTMPLVQVGVLRRRFHLQLTIRLLKRSNCNMPQSALRASGLGHFCLSFCVAEG